MTSASTTPLWIALSRLTHGCTGDLHAAANAMGYAQWVDDQLARSGDDAATAAELAATRFTVQYNASATWPAVNETRPLSALTMTQEQCWALRQSAISLQVAPIEITLLPHQIRMATMIRQISSQAQIYERLVAFWHNHFSVAAGTTWETNVSFPHYDRDVIRRNAFGNFRTMLEAVASSPEMLFYLDNATSRATTPNENYARELMELRTLGISNYYDHQYTSWDQVPGAIQGLAAGYTDDDVISAAKAFSGWTVSFGTVANGRRLPNTGTFVYEPSYHSTAAARVLGQDLAPYSDNMAAGRRVLDILHIHPGTADFVVKKMVTWLMGAPEPNVVARAKAAWTAALWAPDQIAQVVRAIALSPEFYATPNTLYRNPQQQFIAFGRAVGAKARVSPILVNALQETGYDFFEFPTPDGMPVEASYWQSTNAILRTTNFLLNAFATSGGFLSGFMLPQTTQTLTNATDVVNYWCQRLAGGPLSSARMQALYTDAATSSGIVGVANARGDTEAALRRLGALIALSPEVTYC